MAYARHAFGLSVRGKDGATARAHFEHAAKRGNAAARAALRAPEYPSRFTYLWEWFLEIHGRRGSGMNGPARLTWVDFDAWARLTARAVTPWEFRVLGAIDDAFFLTVIEATA